MKFKQLFLMLCLGIVLTGGFTGEFTLTAFAQTQSHGQEQITVLVDGLPVVFDVQPIIVNGHTLVPFRAIAGALNVEVNWDTRTQTVSTTDGKTVAQLQIGHKTAYRNDIPIILETPPIILNGRTLIPLRFLGEAHNCEVVWDSPNNTVKIISPPRRMEVVGFYALGDKQTSSWTNLFGKPFPETSRGRTDTVGSLALGWYSLDKDGSLLTASRTGWQKPDGWEKVLEAAKKYHMQTEMVVHITDGDGTLSSLLIDENAMARAVHSMLKEAVFYRGINLDFEGLGLRESNEQLKTTRNAFSRFVELLAEQTQATGLKLTLTLHAPNSAYQGYDYQTLGKIADRIIVMAYDYGAKPEPNLQVIQAVEAALKDVPKEKLLLGISIPSEDPESAHAKAGIAKRYGLSGIALWRLGLLTEEMWGSLQRSVVASKAS